MLKIFVVGFVYRYLQLLEYLFFIFNNDINLFFDKDVCKRIVKVDDFFMIMMFIMDVYLQLLEYLILVEDVFEYFYIFV